MASATADPVFLLVLTASIVPSQGVSVARADPAVRLADYKNALKFWLHHEDARLTSILFIENSGYDLTELRAFAAAENTQNKSLEFISTAGCVLPEGLHYGVCELKMLDEALDRSSLVKEATHLIKVTGRLTFPTLSTLLDKLPRYFDVVADCRIPTMSYQKGRALISAHVKRVGAYAATQLVVLSLTFYRTYLYGQAQTMDPTGYPTMIESLLYEQMFKADGAAVIYYRFPVSCEPVGIGATGNVNYNNWKRQGVSALRSALRPTGLWI